MNPLMVLALASLLGPAALPFEITIGGNSLSYEYCTVDCDSSQISVDANGLIRFDGLESCWLYYYDLGGGTADITLVFQADMALTGQTLILGMESDLTLDTESAKFDGRRCYFSLNDIASGSMIKLSGWMPEGIPTGLTVTICAVEDQHGATSTWSTRI
jgi:hypothetical protein